MSQASASNVIRLVQPSAGEIVTVPINADNMMLGLGFAPDPNNVAKEGQNLVFSFEDGGKIVLQGYYDHFTNKTLPVMVTDGGDQLPGEQFLASLREDLLTAAGPAAGPGNPSSGSGEYADDPGNLINGIDRLGSLGTIYWDRETEVPENYGGLELPGGSFGAGVETDGGSAGGLMFSALGTYEDWKPSQNLVDPATAPEHPGHLVFNFTPTGSTVVDNVALSGFTAKTEIWQDTDGDGKPDTLLYTVNGPGEVINLSYDQLVNQGIYVKAPANDDADMNIHADVTIRAQSSGITQTMSGDFGITVDAVADKPIFNSDSPAGFGPGTGDIVVEDEDPQAYAAKANAAKFADKVAQDITKIPVDAPETVTTNFTAKVQFGDYEDDSESHYALVEYKEGWTCTSADGSVTYDTLVEIKVDPVTGVPLEDQSLTEVNGLPVATKQFIQIPVDNADLAANNGVADLSLKFTISVGSEGFDEYKDTTISLDIAAMAVDHESDNELRTDNNTAVTPGKADVVIDVIDSTMTLEAGWASEGLNSSKHTGGTVLDAGAPLTIGISGDTDGGSAEFITSAIFNFDSDRGTLEYNGAALTPVGVDPVTGFDIYELTFTKADNVTSINNLVFKPVSDPNDPQSYNSDDVDIKYTVKVENGAGSTATYKGETTVVVDAVADRADDTSAELVGNVGNGNDAGKIVVNTDDDDRRDPNYVSTDGPGPDSHDTKGWETDHFSLDYSGVTHTIGLKVSAVFPDTDGSENHYILVQNPGGAWTLDIAALPAGYSCDPNALYTAADGNKYFKIFVKDSTQGDVVDLPLSLSCSGIPGDATVNIKTGTYVEEVDGKGTGGREYVDPNNYAEYTDGSKLTYKIDVLNSGLTVKTGWGSEGANDAKHIDGVKGAGYQVAGDYAESTGAANSAYDGCAPIKFNLDGAVPAGSETIKSITFEFDGTRGTLELDSACTGTLVPGPGANQYTYTGAGADNVTMYFRPAAGYDYSDVSLKYSVTVKNTVDSEYTFKGSSQIAIDAVADMPDVEPLADGADVTYPNMIDPKTGETVEQTAAKPGDSVKVSGKVTFDDDSGGEDHFILVENGKTSGDLYTVQSVTIMAGGQSLTLTGAELQAAVTAGTLTTVTQDGVTYYKIPVDNPVFTNGDKIGTFDVDITIKTQGTSTHTNSVGFGGRAEVAQVDTNGDGTPDRSGGAAGGAANDNYEFDLKNNESNDVTSVEVKTQGIDTKAGNISAAGGDTYEHDWAKNNLPDPLIGNKVAGTATDESNTELSGGVNIGMKVTPAGGEYVSKVEITLWEPNDANADGKPDSNLGNSNSWHEDSSRGHIVYDGAAYYPDANGKIILGGFTGNFVPSKVVFVADGHESGKVQLRIGVTVTDSSNGLTGTFPITANVNVDAVATRSGDIKAEASYGDDTLHAVATGGTFAMKITTSFFDLDGSENKYVLVEQLPGFTPTGAYTVQYYDLDGNGIKPYFKIAVTQDLLNKAMLDPNAQVTDADGHKGVKLTVPVEFKVDAGENIDGYKLHTGTVVEETRIDHNAEAGDYNNVAVRQGPIESVSVSNAHGGSSHKEVWAYENDRPDMHTGDPDAKGGVDLPVTAAKDANDSIDGQVTISIDSADSGKGVFTYGGTPLTFVDGKATVTYDPAAKLHFTPNDKIYDDHDIKVTLTGKVKDGLSGDTSGFTSEVLIKMDAVADLPGLPAPGSVTVDYSGVAHDLSKALAGDDGTAAAQLPRSGGTIELNNIQVTFHDFDGSEQHFLLLEAKAGMSVGGRSDWETFEQPVYGGVDGKELLGHTTYFKIPLDGAGAIDGSYVHWNGDTATVDHISVTLPANRYADQGLGKLSYGGLAHDQTSGDAELTFHNNTAANTDGSIDINWAPSGGGVWVDGLYENNTPNAHIGDNTQVYGQLHGLGDAAPAGADSVKITIDRGVLVNSSDPATAQGYSYTVNPDGSHTYIISKADFDKIFVKLPEDDNNDKDLHLAGTTGGLKYSFVETTTVTETETVISQDIYGEFKNESSLVLYFDPKDALTITLPGGLTIIDKDGTGVDQGGNVYGWEKVTTTIDGVVVTVDALHIYKGGGSSWADLLPGIKFATTPGNENFDFNSLKFVLHNGKDLKSSVGGMATLETKTTTTTTTTEVVTETDPKTVDVWVDAVAQIPLDVKGGLTTYSDGDKYAESGETVTLHVNATFVDIDATTRHAVLIEAKPGWECVDGAGKAYGIVYVDGKAYYSVPVNPDPATGNVSVDVSMKTADPASLAKDANGIAHEDFKVGVMSTDKTVGDGEITLGNNVAVLFPEDATVSVDISPVDSAIGVSVGSGYEDNIGGGSGIPVKLAGLSGHTLEGGVGAQETLSDVTFTFKAGAGKLVYNGSDCANITDNGDGTVTVSIPGFDTAKSLNFVPANNHSAKDVNIDWSCKVTDQLSHDTKNFSGSSTMVIDAVAHTPTAVGEDTLGMGGHTAVAAGGSFTAEFDVTFVNDGGDQKFILVESLPQWALENGATYELVYPSGSPTAAGGVFYKIPLDSSWAVTDNGDGTFTVHAKVTLFAPSGITGDGSVDIRYGGMTYDPNAAGDGETSLINNVAYNTGGTMNVDYAMVQATTIKVTAEKATMNEGDAPMKLNFSVTDGHNDTIKDVTIKVPAGGTLIVDGTEFSTAGQAVTITAAQLGNVYFQPNDTWSGKVTLDITKGTLTDLASGAEKAATTLTDGSFTIVDNHADAATGVTASGSFSADHGQYTLNIGAHFPDVTGETHYFLVSAIPGLIPDGGTLVHDPAGLTGDFYKIAVTGTLSDPSATLHFTAEPGYVGGNVDVHAVSVAGTDTAMATASSTVHVAADGFDHYTTHGSYDASASDLPVHMFGGAHNDTIQGGLGDDLIYGGKGSDTMWGGGGEDLFAWKAADMDGSTDKIMDFQMGQDKLYFQDLLSDGGGLADIDNLLANSVLKLGINESANGVKLELQDSTGANTIQTVDVTMQDFTNVTVNGQQYADFSAFKSAYETAGTSDQADMAADLLKHMIATSNG